MATSTSVVDGALYYILAISALLLYLIVFTMVLFLVRYRKSRNPVPQEIKGNWMLEAVWVIVPTLIVTTMFIYGLTGFHFLRSVPNSIVVKVRGTQWSWLFEYDDGRKSADMIVPLGRNIKCELIATDVIHGFYVPAFRIQEDMVPGVPTHAWFNASTLGSYYILCSQYCGQKHSAMIARVIVVPPEQYAAWRRGEKIKLDGDPYANMPEGQALLFQRGCTSCHSLDGARMVGPTLKGLFGTTIGVSSAGTTHEITVDSAYVHESIANPATDVVAGFPNTMPSGKDLLSPSEIAAIVKYLETLK